MGDFHNSEGDLDRFRFRLGIASLLVLLAFAILTGRFVWLQIVQHDFYRTRAEDNRIALIPIVPNRGVITDRNGVVLARNYSAFTLEITPSLVGELDATIEGLAEVIEIQAKDRKRFKRLLDEAKNFESIPIRTRLTDAEVAKFAAQRYRRPQLGKAREAHSTRPCDAPRWVVSKRDLNRRVGRILQRHFTLDTTRVHRTAR